MPIEAILFDLYGTLVDIWTDENDPSTTNRIVLLSCPFAEGATFGLTDKRTGRRYRPPPGRVAATIERVR
jgi:FMN phosphatase YigB (HAD superfamily)